MIDEAMFDSLTKASPMPVEEVIIAAPIKVTYEDFKFDDLMKYAGIDCLGTSGILGSLFPEIIKEETMLVPNAKGQPIRVDAPAIIESVMRIEMPANEFICDLEINGIKYSPERNRWFSEKMMAQVESLDEKIFSALGKRINLDSGTAVAQFLYEEKGFLPPYMTKGGEPATDGAALMTLAGLDPVGGEYLTKDEKLQWLSDMALRRDVSSVHNTFVKTYVADFVKRTGRIHPSYNLFGTSSFRITGSDPNLTQLPRAKHGYNVRCCYTVENGMVFISFDFSSAEVKILANLAKEPAMLKAIADGLNFHAFSASSMYGIPYAEFMEAIKDEDHPLHEDYTNKRQLCKILTFSILYGASVGGIAKQLYIENSQAQALMDMYFNTFPGVRKFIDDSHSVAKWNQFVITPLGQRKREYGTFDCFKYTAAYNAALRNAQNVIIQSTTSSVGLITFAELNERIKPFGAKSICTVNVGGPTQ